MPSGKQYYGELIEHWKALPHEAGLVPLKTSFSPMKVYQMLPNLYFSERTGKYQLQLRLMGEELEASARNMAPSRNVFDGLHKECWDIIEEYYDTLCSHPCAGHLVRTIKFPNGLVYDIESIGLPLASSDGEPRFIMGIADLRHNQDKSVAARRPGAKTDEISLLEYWDLGYGVPDPEEYRLAKRAAVSG